MVYLYIRQDSAGSQAVVQLVQQWLSTNEKSKNPAVVQSVRLDVATGLQYPSESERSRF